jgi:hypothetical protein
VPTEVRTRFGGTTDSYQYSVTQQEREIDHSKGSHGMAGLFFKYELSSVKVIVFEESESVVKFLVRLCATVGGIYATSGEKYSLRKMGKETRIRVLRSHLFHQRKIRTGRCSTFFNRTVILGS